MSAAVSIDPQVMHGTPCFPGTRVPVQTLFDYLEDDESVEFFLEQYPSVRREQVTAVLQLAARLVLGPEVRSVAG